MTALPAFIITLGILVIIHEYGHFIAARCCNVKVIRFSIGFGRALYSWKAGKDQTEFVIAAIPLGGYVRMQDDEDSQQNTANVNQNDHARSFQQQTLLKRSCIVLAGPMANFLLALLLYWVLFMSGISTLKPILGEIPSHSPASRAGLLSGDMITHIDGAAVRTWKDIRWQLRQNIHHENITITTKNQQQRHVYVMTLPSGVDSDDNRILDHLGLTPYQPKIIPEIGGLLSQGAAKHSGMQIGDVVVAVNGAPVPDWQSLVTQIRQSPNKPLNIHLQRKGETLSLTVTPQGVMEARKLIGQIGAEVAVNQKNLHQLVIRVHYDPITAWRYAWFDTTNFIGLSFNSLIHLITGEGSWRDLGGPVTIASYAGKSLEQGWSSYLSFLAIISINLGVINLLPLPMLDGGHLMYYTAEFVRGRPLSHKTVEWANRFGLVLLVLLAAVALYNDINRVG